MSWLEKLARTKVECNDCGEIVYLGPRLTWQEARQMMDEMHVCRRVGSTP